MTKVYLICDSETIVNILPDVAKKLKQEILDIKCTVDYAASRLDIPLKIQQNAVKSDIVFVFVLYPKETSDISILLTKLIDLELELKKPIIKAVKESELEEISDSAELNEEKNSLAVKWANYILRFIKKPESFSPQYSSKEDEQEFGSYAPFK
ncbi:MAG: hypothetical protein AABW72_04260 [archaeon]